MTPGRTIQCPAWVTNNIAVKITSRHAADLKNRESQFECDLAVQAAKFEKEKQALTQRFKNEICDLRKVL